MKIRVKEELNKLIVTLAVDESVVSTLNRLGGIFKQNGYLVKIGKASLNEVCVSFPNAGEHIIEVINVDETTKKDTIKKLFAKYDGYLNKALEIEKGLVVNCSRVPVAKVEKEREVRAMSERNGLFTNLKVGKAGSRYAITYFGDIAFNGKSYRDGQIYECQGMTIDFDMLYLIPAFEVAVNDVIEKEGVAYYVTKVEKNSVDCINLETGKVETIVKGGAFGLTVFSKVFNPFGATLTSKDGTGFGNILLMKSLMGDGKDSFGDNGLVLAMLMTQGGFKFPSFELPKATTEKEGK